MTALPPGRLVLGFDKAELDELEGALEQRFRINAELAARTTDAKLLASLEQSARLVGSMMIRVRDERMKSRKHRPTRETNHLLGLVRVMFAGDKPT